MNNNVIKMIVYIKNQYCLFKIKSHFQNWVSKYNKVIVSLKNNENKNECKYLYVLILRN
jgi:hypothetical protein